MNLTKARKPQHAFRSVSKLCTYLLRHDKSMPNGHDGGRAISVILNEIRSGAGCGSGRSLVRDWIELTAGGDPSESTVG